MERCFKTFAWEERGTKWQAHHRDGSGPTTLENCEILCLKCEKSARARAGAPSADQAPFPDAVVSEAFQRSVPWSSKKGRCECVRDGCRH